MNGQRMYKFLEKIGYTRVGGSKEELEVANIIKEYRELGGAE